MTRAGVDIGVTAAIGLVHLGGLLTVRGRRGLDMPDMQSTDAGATGHPSRTADPA